MAHSKFFPELRVRRRHRYSTLNARSNGRATAIARMIPPLSLVGEVVFSVLTQRPVDALPKEKLPFAMAYADLFLSISSDRIDLTARSMSFLLSMECLVCRRSEAPQLLVGVSSLDLLYVACFAEGCLRSLSRSTLHLRQIMQ